MSSHDRIQTKEGYPKQIKNLIVYHRSVYKWYMYQKYQNYIYAYQQEKNPPLDSIGYTREGESIIITF
jgi:hypothetical protein